MRKMDEYLVTIDTIYPDGCARERQFRSAGDMLEPGRPMPAATGRVARLWQAFRAWRQKRDGRLALRELTDAQLLDIGVTRREARDEISKSFFWD